MLLLATPLVTGCDAFKQAMDNADAVVAEVEKETGVKVDLSFEIADGEENITVNLPANTPSAASTQTEIIRIVKKHFPNAKKVTLSM